MNISVDDILVCKSSFGDFKVGDVFLVTGYATYDYLPKDKQLVIDLEDSYYDFFQIYECDLDKFTVFTEEFRNIVYVLDFEKGTLEDWQLEFLRKSAPLWVMDVHNKLSKESKVVVDNKEDDSLEAIMDDLPKDDACDLQKQDKITYLKTCIELSLLTKDEEWFSELTKELKEIDI